MKKVFKKIFLFCALFVPQINITGCMLLTQLKPLVVQNAENSENNDPLKTNFTKEDYQRIVYDMVENHGKNVPEISEIEFFTIRDTNILRIIQNFFGKSFHSYFTLPSAIKQITQNHSTRNDAESALKKYIYYQNYFRFSSKEKHQSFAKKYTQL